MKKPTLIFSTFGVVAMFLLLVLGNYLAGKAKQRIDLTAEKAYTLSAGTRAILARVDTPIQIRFYCTQNESGMPVFLKTFAQRVEDLLGEYQQASKGQIEIQKLNPEPDSDAEDSAKLDGVEGQMLPTGERIYLGVSVSMLDQKEALPFLTPDRERLLEYDLSRAIARVLSPEKPVIGVMSSLPVMGAPSMDMMQMGRRSRPWIFISELKRDFDVREVPVTSEEIPAEIKQLVVIHPKSFSPAAQYAIDQFVLRGGKLLAFLDPLSALERPNQQMMMMGGGPSSSNLELLLKGWGLTFDDTKVLADLNYAVRMREGRTATVLALTEEAMNKDDVVTAQADNLVLPYAGVFSGSPAQGVTQTVLLSSTQDSQLVEAMMAQMAGERIIRDFKPSGTSHPIGIRLTGKFKTAFPEGKPKDAAAPAEEKDKKPEEKKPEGLKEATAESTVVLIGDADFIQDPVAVQEMQNPFGGEPMVMPTNGNLALAQGIVEQLTGDANLISIRSRASRERPFTVVKKMQADAEDAFRSKIKEMEESLAETQSKLNELQRTKGEGQRFILSPEQQKELENFQQKEAQVRKDLKQERKKLRAGIDSLENRVKWINIAAMPVLVALSGVIIATLQRKRVTAK